MAEPLALTLAPEALEAIAARAAELGIQSADKPAMPCLASRLPYGTTVDPRALAQIDRAETALRALGYRDLRVRHLGSFGRVELGESDLAMIRTEADREAVARAVTSSGFVDAEIDASDPAVDRMSDSRWEGLS